MGRAIAVSLPRALAARASPLSGSREDFDPLLKMIGDARVVLVGEATHGTHEFYRLRAELTKRLVVEKGFDAVAAEADWPDAYRVDRYVRRASGDADAEESLRDFRRFPAWMWRNADVLDFVGWLRAHNERIDAPSERVGFYGLDLYSLHASVEAVIGYLEKTDPAAAERARYRYGCFDQYGEDPQAYGYAASIGLTAECERAVVAQLVDLQRRRGELVSRGGLAAEDAQFHAEQNARVVVRAEEYYRSMFAGRVTSWNLRDTHMADTLDALLAHLDRRAGRSKVVVWAHNSHVGDARATEMGQAGEVNIGQLARERHGDDVRLIGFSTFTGTVTAASAWDGPAERKMVRPGLPGSYERLFHEAGSPSFLLLLRGVAERDPAARDARLQRAIGVLYLPRSERVSHYFTARVARQFDAVLHVDETRAVEPLERASPWERGELPETYPVGL